MLDPSVSVCDIPHLLLQSNDNVPLDRPRLPEASMIVTAINCFPEELAKNDELKEENIELKEENSALKLLLKCLQNSVDHLRHMVSEGMGGRS